MCIICIKEKNVNLPTTETIENMWYNNADGAGVMYPTTKGVQIRKGFMTLKAFKKGLEAIRKEIDTTATPMILHFRIGTHGGDTAENTHPFPISDKLPLLQSKRLTVPLAVAHNGIISITPSRKDISDTMEYVMSQMYPLYQLKKTFYKDVHGLQLIYNAIQSKMAIMDAHGYIATVGDFIKDGLLYYSNTSYKAMKYAKWDIWDDYGYTLGKFAKKDNAKYLTWLDDDKGYVQCSDGTLLEACYYLIDISGQLYAYDFENDVAEPMDGTYYTHNGISSNGFNADQCEYIRVVK